MKIETTLRVLTQLAFFTGAAWSATNTTNASSSIISALLADGNVDLGDAETAYQSAKTFVAGLTNAQKVSIITGSSLTGDNAWSAMHSTDGDSGINHQFFTSAFPMPSALITTWNRVLFEENFKAMGQEFYDDGYNLVDGIVTSPLGRVPLGGRQPEGFTPDPYLSGIATGLSVSGMQASGVIHTGRHFLLYEQETNRQGSDTTRYSSNADDKTLHEIYAWPFGDGVKAGLVSVMCAMNRVNDTLSCENNALLSGILKTELGFPGMVLPDVSSQSTAFGSANAGLDYAANSQYWSNPVIEAGIASGVLTQARLDDMAERTVLGSYYVGLVGGSQTQPALVSSATEFRDVRGNHSALIRQVGGEALVLLKNTNSDGRGLPLNKPRTIALFGSHAGPGQAGPNVPFSVGGTDADTYQGHLTAGGGSGESAASLVVTPYQAIIEHAYTDRSMLWYILNDTFSYDSGSYGGGGPGGGGGGGFPSKLRSRQNFGGGSLGSGTDVTPSYTNYALHAEACICFINAASGEGADRSSLLDTDQDTMILTVAATCNNTIVVANVAGPRVIGAWADHENVTAILYSGLLGEESGNAIADVLYGEVNPSGKLAYTLVKNETDYPASVDVCDTSDCDYSEGVYLDYRYFAANNISVLYPFGHGLSYTSFTYGTTLTVSVTNETALASRYPTGALSRGGSADLFDEVVSVTATIANTGAIDGLEIAQLYLSFPDEAEQPAQILRGFEKVSIAAGASAEVEISLRRRDVSFWDVAAQKWAIASGTYTVAVGASSQDIKATGTFTV